jgi:hypothetical protein
MKLISSFIVLFLFVAVLVAANNIVIDSNNLEEFFSHPELFISDEQPSELSSFKMDDLRQQAAYSSIARCLVPNQKSVTNWSCAWCKDGKVPVLTDVRGSLHSEKELGWYAGFDAKNNRTMVVFKSTSGFQNWLLNLDFGMVSYPGCQSCKVHKGFLTAYQILRPVVVKAINELQRAHGEGHQIQIVITGHSLGAALTTHAVADFHNGVFHVVNFNGIEFVHNLNNPIYNELSHSEFLSLHAIANNQSIETSQLSLFGNKCPKQLQQDQLDGLAMNQMDLSSNPSNPSNAPTYNIKFPIFNFGSPRVFNQAGSDWFNSHIGGISNFRRVTHLMDTVVHVPMLSLGGRHVGHEIYFYNKNLDMSNRECSTIDSEDSTCSRRDIAIDLLQHRWYGGYDMLQDDSNCR